MRLRRRLLATPPEAEATRPRLRPARRPANALRCAYCRGGLGDSAAACPGCAVLVHADCQLDRCPTLGCGNLEAWEWRDLRPPPSGTTASPTRPRWAVTGLLMVLSALGGAVASAAVVRERPAVARAGSAEPASPSSPWFDLHCGSTIVTRTERSRAVRWMSFACGLDGSGESSSGWRRDYPPSIVRRHLLLWRRSAEVRVNVEVEAPAALAGTRRLTIHRAQTAVEPAELLSERRAVSVDVPAGTFTCTFRKERRFDRPHHGVVVVETWTDPSLPVPVREVVTWRPLDAPEGQLNRDVTEIVGLDVTRRDS